MVCNICRSLTRRRCSNAMGSGMEPSLLISRLTHTHAMITLPVVLLAPAQPRVQVQCCMNGDVRRGFGFAAHDGSEVEEIKLPVATPTLLTIESRQSTIATPTVLLMYFQKVIQSLVLKADWPYD
jgi:hypothetical protein